MSRITGPAPFGGDYGLPPVLPARGACHSICVSWGAPCTHQFLATLTVQTTKIKPNPNADHHIGILTDDKSPVVVIPRDAQHSVTGGDVFG